MGKNDTMRNDFMKHFVPAGGQISLDLSPIVNRLWRLSLSSLFRAINHEALMTAFDVTQNVGKNHAAL